MKSIILKPGREKSVLRHHPWIFSGAIARVEGNPQPGEIVRVLQADKTSIASAAISPKSSITARIWSWNPEEEVDEEFVKNKMRIALDKRTISPFLTNNSTNAYRLIHAESDGLPGIIVDRYVDWLVVQLLTTGAEYWKTVIVQTLIEFTGVDNIFERSDVDVRQLEGLPQRFGSLSDKEPPDTIEISENGIKYLVNIKTGQKTGFYLDQRENRQKVTDYAPGKSVLNCFCYSGGFSLNAARGGASEVISVDSSSEALALAQKNAQINKIDPGNISWVNADVFQQLRRFRDEGKTFDMVILDPPKFAPTVQQVDKAARGYKDINLLAFKLLKPGGILFTFSCSGGISMELFQKIVADAALDAGVNAQILEKLHQAADHPIALNFPESEYLKGMICQI
jgi:23S rRNA (cytosine1962-C5)-methyltransferase